MNIEEKDIIRQKQKFIYLFFLNFFNFFIQGSDDCYICSKSLNNAHFTSALLSGYKLPVFVSQVKFLLVFCKI